MVARVHVRTKTHHARPPPQAVGERSPRWMASVRRRHASKPSSWIIEVTDVDDAGSIGSPPDRLGIDGLCHSASIEHLADPGQGGLSTRRRLLAEGAAQPKEHIKACTFRRESHDRPNWHACLPICKHFVRLLLGVAWLENFLSEHPLFCPKPLSLAH